MKGLRSTLPDNRLPDLQKVLMRHCGYVLDSEPSITLFSGPFVSIACMPMPVVATSLLLSPWMAWRFRAF